MSQDEIDEEIIGADDSQITERLKVKSNSALQ